MNVLVENADVLDIMYENRQRTKFGEENILQPMGIVISDFIVALEVIEPHEWYKAKSECRNMSTKGFSWKLADSERLLMVYQNQRNIDVHSAKLERQPLPNDMMFWCSDYHSGAGGQVFPLAFDFRSGRISVESTDKKYYALAVIPLNSF